MIVYKSNYNSPRHSEGIFDARGNPFPCGSKSRAMLCIAKMRIATVALLPRNDMRYSIVR